MLWAIAYILALLVSLGIRRVVPGADSLTYILAKAAIIVIVVELARGKRA